MCAATCNRFQKSVRYVLRVQTQELTDYKSVDKVNAERMKSLQNCLSRKVGKLENEVILFEAMVNYNIESTRKKRMQSQEENEKKNIELSKTKEEINLIPGQISNLEIECRSLENAARELTSRANELENEKEKHGIVSGIGFAVTVIGTLLIPVSGMLKVLINTIILCLFLSLKTFNKSLNFMPYLLCAMFIMAHFCCINNVIM